MFSLNRILNVQTGPNHYWKAARAAGGGRRNNFEKILLYWKKKKSCIGERFKTSDCSKSSGSQKSAETILQHWWTKCCG